MQEIAELLKQAYYPLYDAGVTFHQRMHFVLVHVSYLKSRKPKPLGFPSGTYKFALKISTKTYSNFKD